MTKEIPALDVVEDSVQLALSMPLRGWIAYYLGTVPFIMGLLYFWSDMSRGAFAYEHVVGGALALTLLFVWMKCWQSVATAEMRALLGGIAPAPWTPARAARTALIQATLQPAGLIARPIAMLITVPYFWVHAFYQNAVVLGDGTSGDGPEVFRGSARQAKLWPRQNVAALNVFAAFAMFVWLNLAIAIALVPSILQTFLGIETPFSRSLWSLFNTTLFASVCAATHLCVDPFLKAFYTLRCFHGQSARTGLDLRVALRRLSLLAVVVFLAAPSMHAAEPRPLEAEQLERHIEKVLEQPEFAWRMPRLPPPEGERGWFGGFMEGAGRTIRGWSKPVKGWMRDAVAWFEDWLRRHEHRPDSATSDRLSGWLNALEIVVYVVGGIALVLIIFLIWRRWRAGRGDREVLAEVVTATPDLASENTVANELPEDEWLRLAAQMAESGELRLALRALYLAGLAHLGNRELIALARFKSNREYERELRRRAREQNELLAAFRDNLGAFERVWYGRHSATAEGLEHFRANLDRIRAC